MEKAILLYSTGQVIHKDEHGISTLETKTLEIPKYLFPRMEVKKGTIYNKKIEYHTIITTYVLVRSNTNKFYYIPVHLRNISYTDNMEELLKEDMINTVHKFQHFNHLFTDDQIQEYLNLKLGLEI